MSNLATVLAMMAPILGAVGVFAMKTPGPRFWVGAVLLATIATTPATILISYTRSGEWVGTLVSAIALILVLAFVCALSWFLHLLARLRYPHWPQGPGRSTQTLGDVARHSVRADRPTRALR